jgi:hypothetical protein
MNEKKSLPREKEREILPKKCIIHILCNALKGIDVKVISLIYDEIIYYQREETFLLLIKFVKPSYYFSYPNQ